MLMTPATSTNITTADSIVLVTDAWNVRAYESFDDLAENIRFMWDAATRNRPMSSPRWLAAWYSHYAAQARCQLQIVVVLEGLLPRAIAPMYLDRKPVWQGGRTLRWMGDEGICSDHSGIVHLECDPSPTGHLDDVARTLAKHWAGCAGQHWDTIGWPGTDGDDPLLSEVYQRLAHSPDLEAIATPTVGTWHLPLPSSWDDFLGCLSKNHRKRCRRWWKEYFESGRATIRVAQNDELSDFWERLRRMNTERRHRVGDSSAFADPRFNEFHLDILGQWNASGRAQLRELYVDGDHVASEYVLIDNTTVYGYQSGMLTRDKGDGYGNLSVMCLIKDAIEMGKTSIDLLRGDEPYKTHWAANRRDCVDRHIATTTLAGRFGMQRRRLKKIAVALTEQIIGT